MKIVSIDVMKLMDGKNCVPGPWNPICVRINTDEGISGYGEAGLCYGNSQNAGFGILKDFGELVIGKDPMKSEEIWNMLQNTFWGLGNGAVIMSGISAIDIALWDIKGKALNAPVHTLLGGKTNDRIRTYASQLQFNWGKVSKPRITPEDYADSTRKAINEGFNSVKVDPIGFDMEGNWGGWNTKGLLSREQLKIVVDRVRAIREAGGEDLDIIIELHSFTDMDTAIQIGQAVEQFNCFYFEEGTSPLNPKLMKEIANKVNIPIASGERIYTRWGFIPFFENRSLSIIQPDLCNCGGITEGKKICDMAHVYDMGVQLHICGGPIATAAALQVEAVIPNVVIHEQNAVCQLDENLAQGKYCYLPENGYFEIPDLPGIGQELTEKTIQAAEKFIIK